MALEKYDGPLRGGGTTGSRRTTPETQARTKLAELPDDGAWYQLVRTSTAKRADNIAKASIAESGGGRIEADYVHDDEAEPNSGGFSVQSVAIARKVVDRED